LTSNLSYPAGRNEQGAETLDQKKPQALTPTEASIQSGGIQAPTSHWLRRMTQGTCSGVADGLPISIVLAIAGCLLGCIYGFIVGFIMVFLGLVNFLQFLIASTVKGAIGGFLIGIIYSAIAGGVLALLDRKKPDSQPRSEVPSEVAR